VPIMRKSLKVKDIDALFRAHPGLLPIVSEPDDAEPVQESGATDGS